MTDLTTIPIRTEKVYHSFYTDKLLNSVIVNTNYHGTIIIPSGFRTDFASSPWWAWMLVPKRGLYDLATLVHDYLYREKMFSREFADAEQYHMMRSLGCPKWQCIMVYLAVRIAGRKRWKEL